MNAKSGIKIQISALVSELKYIPWTVLPTMDKSLILQKTMYLCKSKKITTKILSLKVFIAILYRIDTVAPLRTILFSNIHANFFKDSIKTSQAIDVP